MASHIIRRNSNLGVLVQSIRVNSSLSQVGHYTSQAASGSQQVAKPCEYSEVPRGDIDWDKLGFGVRPADYMYVTKCSKDGRFEQGNLTRYGNLQLSPAAGVLNNGQGLYEITKAYRKEDGNLLLFRPDQNFIRMKLGADRMNMPCPCIDQFVDSIKQIALANKRWTPPPGKGFLYIRPLLMESGPIGLSTEYTFAVYASPVGNFLKEGCPPLNICFEEFHRASLGLGGIKCIFNYALSLKAGSIARSKGFAHVMHLDSVNKKNSEELPGRDIFLVKDNVIATPVMNGTIPGITRKSIVQIAQDLGYQVEERIILLDELMNADEVFFTLTALGVAPIGSITYQDQRVEYKKREKSVSQELYSTLEGIKRGIIEDKHGWTIEI